MSLVDRWLSRPMSQRVADRLRHENPQNSANFVPVSQKSQKSQAPVFAGSDATTSRGQPTDWNTDRPQPKIITPISWHEQLVSPELRGTPYDNWEQLEIAIRQIVFRHIVDALRSSGKEL